MEIQNVNADKINKTETALADAFNKKAPAPISSAWTDKVMLNVRRNATSTIRTMNESNTVDCYAFGAVLAFLFAVVLVSVTVIGYMDQQQSKYATAQVKLDESEIIENIILQEKI